MVALHNAHGDHSIRDVSQRPEAEWISIPAPQLRIVSTALWTAARKRLTGIKAKLIESSEGRIGRRSRDVESVHLLTGFARCAVCGASFYPPSRNHVDQRAFFYGCSANHKRGHAVCGNGFVMRKERIDDAVLKGLAGDTLRPAVVSAVLDGVLDALQPKVQRTNADRYRAELATVERETGRLTEAIAAGGQLDALLVALKARQGRQGELRRAILAAEQAQVPRFNRRTVEAQVREHLNRWRALLTGNVGDGRELLRQVLEGPIQFTPDPDERQYHFKGDVELGRLFSGIAGLAPFFGVPNGRCTL